MQQFLLNGFKHQVYSFADFSQLTNGAAKKIAAVMQQAVMERGVFHWSLAGGRTPIALYQLLSTADFANLPWQQTHAWFGDERIVPSDHPENNGYLAQKFLFDYVPLTSHHIHRLPCALTNLRYNVYNYECLMKSLLPQNNGIPILDLIILGMGNDGHIASLFPESCALHQQQCVVANYVPQLKAWRVTMTKPIINQARYIMLLVSGVEKASTIKRVFVDNPSPPLLPIQQLAPQGEINWYLDQAAWLLT